MSIHYNFSSLEITVKDLIQEKLENSLLVMGFSQNSIFPPLLCEYLVSLLDMDFIGYIESPDLMTTAIVRLGRILPPIRIYLKRLEESPYDSLSVLSSWIKLGASEEHSKNQKSSKDKFLEYSKAIVDWIKEKEIDTSMIFDILPEGIIGIATEKPVYVATSNEAEDIAVNLLELEPYEGIITGFYGALLNYARRHNIDLLLILIPKSGSLKFSKAIENIIHTIEGIIRVKFPEKNVTAIINDLTKIEDMISRSETEMLRTESFMTLRLYR